MKNLITHPDFGNIRIEFDNGEPWFAAKDICNILGYKNDRDAISKHCRELGVAKRDTNTPAGKREANYINEGNLYRLILKSNMPQAERFEGWVCDEVLPSIRKYGKYDPSNTPKPIKLEWYQNEVCVSAGSLIANNIVTKSNYSAMVKRGNLIRVRKSCYGKTALVVYDSLPSRFKDKIKLKFGILPQPKMPMTLEKFTAIAQDICKIEDETLRISLMQKITS